MRHWKHLIPAIALLGGVFLFTAESGAQSASVKVDDKAAIEKIVRDYLIANPEVIEEAIRALQAKREIEEQNRAKAAVAAHRDALRAHPMTPVSGNPKGDVTVVEFFDYQCGYCKRSLALMVNLLRADKNIRVVWKEMPILGPASRFAARAAMAAKRQDKYFDFHISVMGARGRLSENKVMSIASDVGLDIEQLKEDMKDPKINAYLDETLQLASSLGIRGTPAFVIGDTLLPGAVDEARMRQIIAETRAGG